jgi:hypothetical protein
MIDAIVQSNYIPLKGYFDMIASVDDFVLYDDRQFTRRDWRNRNKIKTPQGLQWLTVPVRVGGKFHQTIRETEIDGADWAEAHWRSIVHNYGRAARFKEVAAQLERVLSDGELRRHLIGNARRKVEEEFDLQKNTVRLGALFARALGWKDWPPTPGGIADEPGN